MCIMLSLVASFEMNESFNLKHWLIQIRNQKIVLVHSIIKSKHRSEKEGEREKKRLRSSERVRKNDKDEQSLKHEP